MWGVEDRDHRLGDLGDRGRLNRSFGRGILTVCLGCLGPAMARQDHQHAGGE